MEIDDQFAKKHIHKWIKAWNDHNLSEVILFIQRIYHSVVLKLGQYILTDIRQQ